MFLIIIGIFALLASFFMASQDGQAARFSKITRIGAIILIIIGASFSMFKVVESGEVGVKTLFGKVNDDVLYSGLNVVNPMMEVTTFDVKTQNYTMSGVNDEGGKSGDDAIRVLSADGLEVIIDLSVLFKVKPSATPEILRTIGTDYLDKIDSKAGVIPVSEIDPNTGRQLTHIINFGNPNTKDWYYFLGLTLSYTIPNVKCYAY
jgi:regulator of protease activity HflC (stomatin/prohibitin superfamily)